MWFAIKNTDIKMIRTTGKRELIPEQAFMVRDRYEALLGDANILQYATCWVCRRELDERDFAHSAPTVYTLNVGI